MQNGKIRSLSTRACLTISPLSPQQDPLPPLVLSQRAKGKKKGKGEKKTPHNNRTKQDKQQDKRDDSEIVNENEAAISRNIPFLSFGSGIQRELRSTPSLSPYSERGPIAKTRNLTPSQKNPASPPITSAFQFSSSVQSQTTEFTSDPRPARLYHYTP